MPAMPDWVAWSYGKVISRSTSVPELLRNIPRSILQVTVFPDNSHGILGITFVRSFPYVNVWCCAICTDE